MSGWRTRLSAAWRALRGDVPTVIFPKGVTSLPGPLIVSKGVRVEGETDNPQETKLDFPYLDPRRLTVVDDDDD